jgi:purine-binding chemotaxis protein CheW
MTTQVAGVDLAEFVTVTIGGQIFGLPISHLQDVFVPGRLTRVPFAPEEVAGVLNLRGRIVTAVDVRGRLGLPTAQPGAEQLAVGVDCDGECYGLIIDEVGEVLKLGEDTREVVPVNLDPRLARVAVAVHRLQDQLLVILDLGRLLDIKPDALAA